MMQRNQDDNTLQDDTSKEENSEDKEEGIDVAYQPSRVAAEIVASMPEPPNALDSADLSAYVSVDDSSEISVTPEKEEEDDIANRPVVLVMARFKTARKALQTAFEAGFATCAVYTKDRSHEPYLRQAQKTVCLGDKYSAALFCNSYAVLKAAEEAEAQVILLCDESEPLATIDSFLARAAARNIQVYRLLSKDAPALGWVLCETEHEPYDNDNWVKCPHCGLMFDESSLASCHYICPACKGYLRMSSDERINDLLDADSFVEWDRVIAETDPLDFPGYTDKLESTREKSGLEEAVRTGEGRIAGLRFALGIMETKFFMGSMGSVVGEKICRMIDRATEEQLPVVIFTASGGARMQEGLVSLMQMAKISCAVERHGAAGLLYISVITDPTTGGVTASFATQGDVIISEPHALLGFAGQRVIRDTIHQELPEGFQTAEFALEHGLIDAIVERENMRETIAHIMAIHMATSSESLPDKEQENLIDYLTLVENLENGIDTYNTATYGDIDLPQTPASKGGWGAQWKELWADIANRYDLPGSNSDRRLERAVARGAGSSDAEGGASLVDDADDVVEDTTEESPAEESKDKKADEDDGVNCAWESVQLARNIHRPTAMAYINEFVDGFIELHGDRMFADDEAIVGGIGWIGGRAVTVIGQEKGVNLKDRIKRNFGCPQPEGYRKSLRLMRQAEKFGRPVVCLVDTQGAFCGMDSEERGQGNAIADNLLALASLRVPVVTVLLGEGGSGGALALALADRVAMQKHAVYSVISPEGFASILWKDGSRAPEAAAVMKVSADESYDLGIIDAVISEGPEPAHENPEQAIENVRTYICSSLDELSTMTADELLGARHERFGKF